MENHWVWVSQHLGRLFARHVLDTREDQSWALVRWAVCVSRIRSTDWTILSSSFATQVVSTETKLRSQELVPEVLTRETALYQHSHCWEWCRCRALFSVLFDGVEYSMYWKRVKYIRPNFVDYNNYFKINCVDSVYVFTLWKQTCTDNELFSPAWGLRSYFVHLQIWVRLLVVALVIFTKLLCSSVEVVCMRMRAFCLNVLRTMPGSRYFWSVGHVRCVIASVETSPRRCDH